MRGNSLMRVFVLVAILVAGRLESKLQAQPLTTPVNVTPDCLVFFDLTAAPTNSASFDNRFIGCDSWTVSYTNTGFATLSLIFQSSPDSSGSPGGFVNFAGGIVAGVNPNVSITQESTLFKGYYPWLRVRLDATTGGPGRVRGTFFGWRSSPTAYAILSGLSTVTANQGTAAAVGGRWPVYLSDGANPVGTNANPIAAGQELYNGATGLWTPTPACTSHAAITIAGAGTTQIVALSGATQIRVCHFSLGMAGATNITLVQGTGANCATGPADITGAYQSILDLALDFEGRSIVTAGAGQALCVTNSAAVAGGGFVTYSRY